MTVALHEYLEQSGIELSAHALSLMSLMISS